MTDRTIKVGVIFLGRKRPGFDPDWGSAMATRVRDALAASAFEVIEPPDTVVDDASLGQALTALEGAGVDAILTLQTTMADARMAPTLHQRWADPIILWATPENPAGEAVSSCSLVGAHAWASVLRHLDHSFEIVYGDPAEPRTIEQLNRAVRIAHTVRTLRRGRLGLIGGTAPGYFAMTVDPLAMTNTLGTQVQTFSLPQFAEAVQALSDDEVAADVEAFKSLGIPHKDTTDDDLPMASRLYLAMRHLLDDEPLTALAVRCWPEMPNLFGQWPYLGMARLAEAGYAVSMEGDGDGALCAAIAASLGMGACYLSDWLEHDDETITLWHGGNLPPSLSPPIGHEGGPKIARHFNFPIPAVVDSTLRADLPVTLFRLWHRDGRYLMTAHEAETLEPKRFLKGSHGLVRPVDVHPHDWFTTLCDEGMPHHLAVCEGRHEALLRRFARAMGFEWVS